MITKSIWGPNAWKHFHFVALAYPEYPTANDKTNYYNFYLYFGKTLPCENCIDHYQETFKKIPIKLDNKATLLNWTIDFHNAVNLELNKKIYSYEEAINLINNNFNNNLNNESNQMIEGFSPIKPTNNMFFILAIILFSLIVIAVLYKKC